MQMWDSGIRRGGVVAHGSRPRQLGAVLTDTPDLARRLDDELADVLAVEQHVDRCRQLLEALDDGLQRGEPALGDQAGDLANRLGRTAEVVEDNEALQCRTLDQQVCERARSGW